MSIIDEHGLDNTTAYLRNIIFDNDTSKFVSKLLPWEDYISGCYLIILGIIAKVLNSLILVRTYFLKSRSLFDVQMCNLAACDLLAGLVYLIEVPTRFYHEWLYFQTGCTLLGCSALFLAATDIYIITAISVGRYKSVCLSYVSLSNDTHICGRKVLPVFTLLPVWVISATWALAALGPWSTYDVEPFGLSCTLNWAHASKYFICCLFFGVFVIPVSITATCYGRIAVVTRAKMKLRKRVKKNPSTTVTKIGLCICVAFVICWTPYAVLSLWSAFFGADMIPVGATVVPTLFAKLAICLNPLVYFWFRKRYREDMKNILGIGRRRKLSGYSRNEESNGPK